MGKIRGFLDGIRDGMLVGWACDDERPGLPLEIQVYEGKRLFAVGIADLVRDDLRHEAPGGRCAFAIAVELEDPEQIYVRANNVALQRSPGFSEASAQSPQQRRFETRAPSHQNALDIFEGAWASDLGPIFPGAISGSAAHFGPDERIDYAVRLFGKHGRLDGMRVLELGPLEGGHTFTLENLGASVLAIDSNPDAFLKCLITKEIAGNRNARFMLGDFVEYMMVTEQRFDLVFACGVLYHMSDPIRAVEAMARVTDRCFVWTHVYDDLTYDGPTRREFVREDFPTIPLFRLDYGATMNAKKFWGGNRPQAAWLRKEDMLKLFRHYGFSIIEAIDMPSANGHAAICFAASRPD